MVVFSFIATLFWGILAGIVVAALVVFVIHAMAKIANWQTVLIGIFLLFYLSFHFAAIFGAAKVKGLVSDIEALTGSINGDADWQSIVSEYPFLESYVGEFSASADEITDNVSDEITQTKTTVLATVLSTLNWFIWRHVAWALGGVVVCLVVAIALDSGGSGTRGRAPVRGGRSAGTARQASTYSRSRAHRR